MTEIIAKTKLYNVVVEYDENDIRLLILSKDEKENYNHYVDWKYLGFDEFEIGFENLMIICEFDVSVNIEDLDELQKSKAIKKSIKVFKNLYKSNKDEIFEMIEDVL